MSKRPRQIYTEEFKQEAVARSKVIGPKKTCEELDLSPSALHRWSKHYSDDLIIINKKLSSKPSYEDLEKENKRLKKEIGYIEEINRVLKKSTAIFSSSHLGGSK